MKIVSISEEMSKLNATGLKKSYASGSTSIFDLNYGDQKLGQADANLLTPFKMICVSGLHENLRQFHRERTSCMTQSKLRGLR